MKFESILALVLLGVVAVASIFYAVSFNGDKALNIYDGPKKEAPELSTIDGYVNTDGKEISLSQYKGDKVVLLDIWTYSCINCQRTLPYINEWYSKYKDQGLEIIGLHTPEFAFERIQSNVEKAVKEFGIQYPVVLDNDYSTWQAYGNQYWPRKYLIDLDGNIIYDHIGEGSYDETEKAIQKALKERADRLGLDIKISSDISDPDMPIPVNQGEVGSPEIYFGSLRNERLANGKAKKSGTFDFKIPETVSLNSLYLDGTWNITDEYAEVSTPGKIVFKYSSKNVYMVASGNNEIEIYKDGKLIKTILVTDEKLYSIIEGTDYSEHTLEIRIKNPSLKAFTFTFG